MYLTQLMDFDRLERHMRRMQGADELRVNSLPTRFTDLGSVQLRLSFSLEATDLVLSTSLFDKAAMPMTKQ